ncbi:hypothetical protein BaRGS_00027664, partial [Batillaria attramentaria]
MKTIKRPVPLLVGTLCRANQSPRWPSLRHGGGDVLLPRRNDPVGLTEAAGRRTADVVG